MKHKLLPALLNFQLVISLVSHALNVPIVRFHISSKASLPHRLVGKITHFAISKTLLDRQRRVDLPIYNPWVLFHTLHSLTGRWSIKHDRRTNLHTEKNPMYVTVLFSWRHHFHLLVWKGKWEMLQCSCDHAKKIHGLDKVEQEQKETDWRPPNNNPEVFWHTLPSYKMVDFIWTRICT